MMPWGPLLEVIRFTIPENTKSDLDISSNGPSGAIQEHAIAVWGIRSVIKSSIETEIKYFMIIRNVGGYQTDLVLVANRQCF